MDAMAVSDVRYVTLKGGPTLPVEPILLALELEQRGFRMTREDGDVLNVQPHERLTAEDCQRIRRWKTHIITLLDYDADVHDRTQ
jgi:hypothetical protein